MPSGARSAPLSPKPVKRIEIKSARLQELVRETLDSCGRRATGCDGDGFSVFVCRKCFQRAMTSAFRAGACVGLRMALDRIDHALERDMARP